MKKYLLFLTALLCAAGVFAQNTQVSVAYTGGRHLNQVKAEIDQALALGLRVGLGAKVADEDHFKHPVSAVYVPFTLGGDFLRLTVTPFYYFKNKNVFDGDPKDEGGRPLAQNSQAFGVSAVLFLTMENDDLNDVYSNAFLGASFARSQGAVFLDNGFARQGYYSQAAFSAGLHRNFYQFLSFEAAGAVFEYPDGIRDVAGLQSVLDQQDLAYMQTFDVVHQLPRYTLGARITRLWIDHMATIYLGYRFGEFYGVDDEHSVILGNTFAMTQTIHADLGYNHLRTVHNENKRDIFYLRLMTKF